MEGEVEVVRKDGGEYGTLQAVLTLAHDNFYSCTPPGSPFTDGRENIGGTVIMQNHDGAQHPTSFQEARGHGAYAWDGTGFPGGECIVYAPSRGLRPDRRQRPRRTLRTHRSHHRRQSLGRRDNTETYAKWGAFLGDNGQDNAAHAPWAWDDSNDGSDLQAGVIATDPAYLVSRYFGNTGDLSQTYLRNPYRS